MKQRVAAVLSGLLFLGLLLSTGITTSFTHRFEPTMQVDAQTSLELPVVMYHHVLKDEARIGDYVITPAMLEADLKELILRGYTAVLPSQLLTYLAGRGTLPDNPILITFDDGYESFYEYAYSLLQQYDTPAVVSIIGKYTDLYSDNPDHHISYSHLTWEQIQEMSKSGLVEIGNHTYGLHANDGGRKGTLRLKSESAEEYRQMLQNDLGGLNRQIEQETGIAPTVFAIPFGAYTEESMSIFKEVGFPLILTCEERVNLIQPGLETPLLLDRYNRAGKYTSKEFFDRLTLD